MRFRDARDATHRSSKSIARWYARASRPSSMRATINSPNARVARTFIGAARIRPGSYRKYRKSASQAFDRANREADYFGKFWANLLGLSSGGPNIIRKLTVRGHFA